MTLKRLAETIGLKPIILSTEVPRRGRPLGRLDSYDRWERKRESLELHAALMRERYGSVRQLEAEAHRPAGTLEEFERELVSHIQKRIKGAALARQVFENETVRVEATKRRPPR